MKNAKQWAIGLAIMLTLVGALVYQAKHSKIGVVEAKGDLDLSVLHPLNKDCSITGPDGMALDLSKTMTIPKGTLIASECFNSKQ